MPSILITGVSSGIGRAAANRFAELGFEVIGTVRDTSARPQGLSDRVALEALDLSVAGAAAECASQVLSAHGCPDVILANAGTLLFGPLEAMTAEQLADLYRVNVFAQLELVRGFLPAMRERRSGTVAFVSSLGGTLTFPFFGAYNSSKWALEGLAEGLWHELKPFGIRVKSIEPGYVATEIWSKALPESRHATDALSEGLSGYATYLQAMLDFEASITERTAPADCAEEIRVAIADTSDRLRYPVAAYARPIVRARRWLGGQALMRFFHRRWMGPNA